MFFNVITSVADDIKTFKVRFTSFLSLNFAGLAAVDSLVDRAAEVRKSILDQKKNREQPEEEKRHNLAMEKSSVLVFKKGSPLTSLHTEHCQKIKNQTP